MQSAAVTRYQSTDDRDDNLETNDSDDEVGCTADSVVPWLYYGKYLAAQWASVAFLPYGLEVCVEGIKGFVQAFSPETDVPDEIARPIRTASCDHTGYWSDSAGTRQYCQD